MYEHQWKKIRKKTITISHKAEEAEVGSNWFSNTTKPMSIRVLKSLFQASFLQLKDNWLSSTVQ